MELIFDLGFALSCEGLDNSRFMESSKTAQKSELHFNFHYSSRDYEITSSRQLKLNELEGAIIK